ncbi:MAG TPA: hypothetical protein VJ742_13100 [Nitrososphaera sp.]|nr:hypothetical protein [Nitrososphaera sp.]
MEKKNCSTCHLTKPLEEFYPRGKTSPGLYYSDCKDCYKIKRKTYAQVNKERYAQNYQKWKSKNPERIAELSQKHKKLYAEKRKKKRQEEYCDLRQELRKFLKAQACKDCGEKNWVLLEFDHVRGKKSFTIATRINSKVAQTKTRWTTILDEIAKCDIVCANCHRLRTYFQNDCWRLMEE